MKDPAEAVSKTLRAEVVAQDGAIDTIVSAIGLWQQEYEPLHPRLALLTLPLTIKPTNICHSRAAGTHYPLVLAISGTTGGVWCT